MRNIANAIHRATPRCRYSVAVMNPHCTYCILCGVHCVLCCVATRLGAYAYVCASVQSPAYVHAHRTRICAQMRIYVHSRIVCCIVRTYTCGGHMRKQVSKHEHMPYMANHTSSITHGSRLWAAEAQPTNQPHAQPHTTTYVFKHQYQQTTSSSSSSVAQSSQHPHTERKKSIHKLNPHTDKQTTTTDIHTHPCERTHTRSSASRSLCCLSSHVHIHTTPQYTPTHMVTMSP